jgi:hypothetical protein
MLLTELASDCFVNAMSDFYCGKAVLQRLSTVLAVLSCNLP